MNDNTWSPALVDRRFLPILLVGIAVELLAILISLRFPLQVLLAIAAIPVIYIAVRNTFAGICLIVLLHFFVIRSTEGVNLFEILFALCFFAVLGAWFFRKVFLERRKILLEGLDYALLGFLGFCVLSIIPAILLGSGLFKWLRELVPFLSLLLIFPLREELNNSKRAKILLACFLLLAFATAINNVFSYKQAVARALYSWEMTSARQHANEPLFMAIVIVSSSFFIMARSKWARFLALLLTTFFGIALIITFSRGYWVAALAGLMVIFWLLPGRYKLRMVTYYGVLASVAIAVLFLFFGELTGFFIDAVSARFQSVGEGARDLSFANRLAEWQAVWEQIKVNPVAGYGLGKMYSYDSLINVQMPNWYVHNTFLFVWYKIGLFALLCLCIWGGGILHRGLVAYKAAQSLFTKALLAGLTACLIAMLVVSFSSPQLVEKDSAMLAALVCSLVQALGRRNGLQNL